MAYFDTIKRVLIAIVFSVVFLQAHDAFALCATMDCVTGNPKSDPQPTKDQAVSNSEGQVSNSAVNTSTGGTIKTTGSAANPNLIYFILSLVIQTEYASNGNQSLTNQQIKELYNIGVTPQQMYSLTVTAGYADENSYFAATCDVFWCSFASPKPPTKNPITTNENISSSNITTSVTQDIISTGNAPTQISVPMSACNFLVNNQNVCTETNVTTATAIISVAVLGGIIAAVTTAVNNEANNQQQREKDTNLLFTLIALQNQNKNTPPAVCYDSATPPNVIPCP